MHHKNDLSCTGQTYITIKLMSYLRRMLTIIFLDNNNVPVSISFRWNEQIDTSLTYGTWDVNNNHVELNDMGWEFLQHNRKDIRKLKPMMDKLKKIPADSNALEFKYDL